MRIARLRPSGSGNAKGHIRIGEIVEKRTKTKKIFYACNQFPKCDFALWDKPIDEKCPECDSLLVETKKGVKCSNKDCQYNKKMAE